MSFTTFQAHPARIRPRFDRTCLLYTAVALHSGAGALMALFYGWPAISQSTGSLILMGTTVIPLFLLFLFAWHFLYLAIVIRPERPLHRFFGDIRSAVLDSDRLIKGTLAMLAILFFFNAFSHFKNHITTIQPFAWDVQFSELDRILHFGRLPHEWLMPALGTPMVTSFLNVAYNLWFFPIYFLLFMASFDTRSRAQSTAFLLAMVLCFGVGGNLLATVFSSAGPVYFQEMGFGADYFPLMNTLYQFDKTAPIWALSVQDNLLNAYYNGGPVRGISAMPSMHVAGSVVMMFYAFTWRRWAGWLMAAYAVIIMLGSVQLAWHYAIDGYFGALVALGCWWLARKLTGLLPLADASGRLL